MSDSIMSSDWQPNPQSEGSVMIAPGSNRAQMRPSLIKRDSDIAGPIIRPMGGLDYSNVPAKNKKSM